MLTNGVAERAVGALRFLMRWLSLVIMGGVLGVACQCVFAVAVHVVLQCLGDLN